MVKGRHGQGVVHYITAGGRVMVVYDKVFGLGHDGNGGCEMNNLPKLPECDGRCYWHGVGELEEVGECEVLEEVSEEYGLCG